MKEDGVNLDCGGPLGCREKGDKRRKSTAGRNLSDLSFIFCIHGEACFTGR